jgi:SAM-dependent methyltransferase
MRMFLRKSSIGREPLAVTMSGVRPGERTLQIGVDDPLIAAAIAAKTGLTGVATIVVSDKATADITSAAVSDIGAPADVQIGPLQSLPFVAGTYDVAIVHSLRGLLPSLRSQEREQALRECWRVLRQGGRLIALEPGTPSGLRGLLGRAPKPDAQYEAGGGTPAVLKTVGFRSVRTLADRQGYRFIEGLKA